jgi:hypothetical protein
MRQLESTVIQFDDGTLAVWAGGILVNISKP